MAWRLTRQVRSICDVGDLQRNPQEGRRWWIEARRDRGARDVCPITQTDRLWLSRRCIGGTMELGLEVPVMANFVSQSDFDFSVRLSTHTMTVKADSQYPFP